MRIIIISAEYGDTVHGAAPQRCSGQWCYTQFKLKQLELQLEFKILVKM